MTLKNNPFEQEENLKDWLEKDQFYLQSKRTDYLNFRKTIKHPGIFMSLQETYLNIVNNITKHSITATLIMLFALGSVGASAAELFAPEDYKPSKLTSNLFNNRQKDKDPYTALEPDQNNYVANLENCDLALKYPKTLNNQKIDFWKQDNYYNIFTKVEGSQLLGETVSLFSVNCFDSKDPNIPNKQSLFSESKMTETKLTTKELRDKTGWFVTEVDLGEIKVQNFKSDFYEVEVINFTYNNKSYSVEYPSLKDARYIINYSDIQIQFNSLVKNKFSNEVLESAKNDGSLITSSCDNLDLRYKPNLIKKENSDNFGSGISLYNYTLPNSSTDFVYKNTFADFAIGCSRAVDDLDSYLETIKTTESKALAVNNKPVILKNIKDIPFLTDEFRSTLDETPGRAIIVTEDTTRLSKESGGPLSNTRGYFMDKNGYTFSFYINNPEIVQKEFDLKVGIKNKLITQNTFTNEEFQITAAQSLALENDRGNGFILQRKSDNKLYAVTQDTIEKNTVQRFGDSIQKILIGDVSKKVFLTLTGKAKPFGEFKSAEVPSIDKIDYGITEITSITVPDQAATIQPSQANKIQSYTNPYFPNFKLNSDDSWKFETTTSPYDLSPNLLSRRITLNKGNALIDINLSPVRIPSGCGPVAAKGVKSGNFYKYQEEYGQSVSFNGSEDPNCILDNKIATNIKLSDVQYLQDPNYNYKQASEDFYKSQKSGTIIYNYTIRVDFAGQVDNALLQETEAILQNSTFK